MLHARVARLFLAPLLTLAVIDCSAGHGNAPTSPRGEAPLRPVSAATTYPVFRLDSLPPMPLTLGQVFTVYAFEQPAPGAAFVPCDSCFIDDKHIVHNGFDTAGTILNYVGGRRGWPLTPHITMKAVRTGPDTIGMGKDNRELLRPVVVVAGRNPQPYAFRIDSVPSAIAVGDTFTVYAFSQSAPGKPFAPCDSCWVNLIDTASHVVSYVGGRQGWPTTPHMTMVARKAGGDTLQAGKNNREVRVPITVH